MIDRIDWGETPDSDTLPSNIYALTVNDVVWETSQNGYLCAHATLQVDAPPEYKGSTVHFRAYPGTADDPDGDMPDTWKKFGAQQLKKFLVGVYGDVAQLSGDPRQDFIATNGYPVLALIETKVEPDFIKKGGIQMENPYAGRDRMNFNKWFSPSDPTAPVAGSMAQQAPGRPTAAPPARPPARPAPTAAPAAAAAPASAAAPVAARTVPARPAPPPRPAARPAPPPRPAA